MMKMKRTFSLLALFFCIPAFAFGASFSVMPGTPVQGEPLMVVVEGEDISRIRSLTFAGKQVGVFLYEGKPTALIPIDLGARAGAYVLKARLTSGQTREKTVTVAPRPRHAAPLGIPQKLGGNTTAAQTNLVTALAKENAALSKIKTSLPPWWNTPFIFPLRETDVVDSYGYSRSTGSYLIPHKGTDFRADVGTPVLAVNSGVVRLVRDFNVYGKTVAIDHGGGVQSLSMHLSRADVNEGQKVTRGERIGLSGESGYALGPHLHLSIRVGGISVDPMAFFSLFGLLL